MATGLQTFTKLAAKCEDERDLLNHALEWEKYLNLYGNHLRSDEATLRTLFLGILPKAMEDKLIHKDKYPTWRELMQYIKDKHEVKRQVMIAEALHKNKGSVRKSYAHALTEPASEPRPAQSVGPTMQDLADMMNALAAKGESRPPRANSRDNSRDRNPKCKGKGGQKER